MTPAAEAIFALVPLAVELYDIGLFLHVALVVVAFGPTFGYAFFQVFAERHFPQSIPNVMRTMTFFDRTIGTPLQILILLAGVYLVLEGGWQWEESFVAVGIVAIVVLLGLVHAVLIPTERKLAALAERDLAGGGELGDEYWAASKQSAIWGSVAGLVVLVAIFFMTIKP